VTEGLFHQRLLLPIGLEGRFFALTQKLDLDGKAGKVAFRMDYGAVKFLAQEMISQGAVAIALDPYSAFSDARGQIALPLGRRIDRIDSKGHHHAAVARVMKPILDELSIDFSESYRHMILSFRP
jgi:hypothetical protein